MFTCKEYCVCIRTQPQVTCIHITALWVEIPHLKGIHIKWHFPETNHRTRILTPPPTSPSVSVRECERDKQKERGWQKMMWCVSDISRLIWWVMWLWVLCHIWYDVACTHACTHLYVCVCTWVHVCMCVCLRMCACEILVLKQLALKAQLTLNKSTKTTHSQ
jgi:hypothetical protein